MAKKQKNEDEVDELEDLDEEDFGDVEDESVYPEIKPKSSKAKTETKSTSESESTEIEDPEIEDLEPLPEDSITFPEYKFLDLNIIKGEGKNDYILSIDNQTHGLCNILVTHLLTIDGVTIAAYRVTGLIPTEVFVRIENGYKIKDVVSEGINYLRKEVESVQKLFQKLMKN